jgi:condensin complex subunit 3
MLERVNSVRLLQPLHRNILILPSQTFEENSTLEGMLSELILPAVNSKNAALRERGLTCLGLCSLIHRVRLASPSCHMLIDFRLFIAFQKMAVNSFRLFTQQVEKARGPMQVNSLKIVFDLLMVYPTDYLNITDDDGVSL